MDRIKAIFYLLKKKLIARFKLRERKLNVIFAIAGISIILQIFSDLFLFLSLAMLIALYVQLKNKWAMLENYAKEIQESKDLVLKNAENEALIIIENAQKSKDLVLKNAENEAFNILEQAQKDNKKLIRKIEESREIEQTADETIDKFQKIETNINKAQIEYNKLLLKTRHMLNLVQAASKILKNHYKKSKNDSFSYNDLNDFEVNIIRLISTDTTVNLPLHALDYKDLKYLMTMNKRSIRDMYLRFEDNYTTKQNRSIYALMVLALKAELQNIIYSLKYANYDKSIENLSKLFEKFQEIATYGNQTIYPTVQRFLIEAQDLFKEALDIEYEYYIKREQAREEQIELKRRIREEKEEAARLQKEKDALLKEEGKYLREIDIVKEQLKTSKETEMVKMLNNRIMELEKQIAEIKDKKEQIVTLQNGKAGYVYIISNMGSFGEKVFKVGMTRRLEPQERVDELSGAGVPFKFDVHAFIFSHDAVELEHSLHKALEKKRVNKINSRKEFFYSSIPELKELVFKIAPTAGFSETMLAEQYRMSLKLSQWENNA